MVENADWLHDLPKSLRQRFDGLGNYVLAVLDEENLRDGLDQPSIQQIQLTIFLRGLNQFLVAGSQAAARTVDVFAELGVTSFRIGSETFEGRNSAVMRGARLSEKLTETVDDERIRGELNRDEPVRAQILRLARELHERRMG